MSFLNPKNKLLKYFIVVGAYIGLILLFIIFMFIPYYNEKFIDKLFPQWE